MFYFMTNVIRLTMRRLHFFMNANLALSFVIQMNFLSNEWKLIIAPQQHKSTREAGEDVLCDVLYMGD